MIMIHGRNFLLPGGGLRDANAFVLVYDLLNPESFEFVSNVFNQLSDARDLSGVPVLVVGNKTDKVSCSGSSRDRYDYTSSKYRYKITI